MYIWVRCLPADEFFTKLIAIKEIYQFKDVWKKKKNKRFNKGCKLIKFVK